MMCSNYFMLPIKLMSTLVNKSKGNSGIYRRFVQNEEPSLANQLVSLKDKYHICRN